MRICTALAGVILVGSLVITDRGHAQRPVDAGFRLSRDASIRITVPAGRITVTGWDHDSVRATGSIPAGGGSWYGGGGGIAAKMGVEGNETATGPGATLDIRVPRGARVWIKTVTTTVEVTGLTGELDALSVTGGITVRGATRALRLESLDGALHLEGDSSVARLRTGAGPIDVRLRTGDITATSVAGAVTIAATTLDRARVETVDGAVRYHGGLAARGALEVETHGGDVTLGLVGPVDAGFALSSVSGTIVVDLGGKPMRSSGRPLEFSTGAATGQVTVRTFKGKVEIRRQ